jgi:hypothetical protein
MATCEVTPISAFLSTNLNSKMECFGRLQDRILHSLGYPVITVELHQDIVFENISIACDLFSKFAGYTQEYLVFDSNLYEKNKGIRLDTLFSVYNSILSREQRLTQTQHTAGPDYYINTPETVYISNSAINGSYFSSSSALSSILETAGIDVFDIFDDETYNLLIEFSPTLSAHFTQSTKKTITQQCESQADQLDKDGNPTGLMSYNNMFDYDTMDYRKVIAVTEFEEGSTTGINTLFTLEQTLAQQTYFSYALGNYGFDLVSWYTLKEWIETREKLLAIRRDIKFDERTQYMQLYPQPRNSRFYGVISCWVERPLRDIIKEQWVYQYALALCKIALGRIYGKFTNINLLGGGSYNYNDLLQEGLREKEALEKMLYESATPGMGDSYPAMFAIG